MNPTNWIKLTGMSLLMSTALFIGACGSDDDDTEMMMDGGMAAVEDAGATEPPPAQLPASVVDVALANPDLSNLVAAVQKAGFAENLANPNQNWTVFAPTNKAIDDAFALLGLTLDTIPVPTLQLVLQHHLITSTVLSSDVVGLTTATTLNGDLGVRVENGAVILTDALGIDALSQGSTSRPRTALFIRLTSCCSPSNCATWSPLPSPPSDTASHRG